MRSRIIPICAGIVMSWSCATHAATYRVGTGPSCTHDDIQEAIDSAEDNAGTDFIRITRSLTYTDVHLTVENQDLVLLGGFADCQALTATGASTALQGNGDDSVLRIRGSGDVVLDRLRISGGHQPRFNYGFGGGIQISGGPHLVVLTAVVVNDNDAGHGGGISIRNDVSGNPADARLVLSDDTVVSNNRAGYAPVLGDLQIHGGGIYCQEASVEMTGSGATSIFGNSADHNGGGIGARECDLSIAPRGTVGSLNGIVLNNAGRDGGGIYASGFSGQSVRIYTAHAQRPVHISGNLAEREGGGLKIEADAHAHLWNAVLEGNRSYDEGGAVSVNNESDAPEIDGDEVPMLTMRGDLQGAPAGAVACAAGVACNRVADNEARNEDGVLQQAAAIRMRMEGDTFGIPGTSVLVRGTRFERNRGANLYRARVSCGASPVGSMAATFDGVVITRNELTGQVLLNPDAPFSCDSILRVLSSTIAGNSIGLEVISSTSLYLRHSVIWQPGYRAILADLHPESVGFLLANDLTGVPPANGNISIDPRLWDAERGDLRLHPSSPVIDYASAADGAEATNQPRNFDLPLVPNDGQGTQDLGAYERRDIGNLVRNPDFAGDLRLWGEAPVGSTWNAADSAADEDSGSIQVIDSSSATRVTALRQCVGVPGPGTYALRGQGWVTANTLPVVLHRSILAWTLRRSDGDCDSTSTIIGAGELDVGGVGWHAFDPQYITVTGADWTPFTTIEVQLILRKRPIFPGDTQGAARFDAISLLPEEEPAADFLFADGFEPVN